MIICFDHMQLFIDCHVHIYPCYELVNFFNFAFDNIDKNAKKFRVKTNYSRAIILAERFDCHYFDKFLNKKINISGFDISSFNEEFVLVKRIKDNQDLYIFPGRQVVTSERLELLALLKSNFIKDGNSFENAYNQVNNFEAYPVLNWAPGKWMFKRYKIVKKIILKYEEKKLALGDTSLRPTIWRLPRLMRLGFNQNLNFIAGSDPLPIAGEEKRVGTYGLYFKNGFDTNNPCTSLRKLLNEASIHNIFGKRLNLFLVTKNLLLLRTCRSTKLLACMKLIFCSLEGCVPAKF